ncbi:MAG: hypothetical protein D3909_14895 [Candidatus Electrothrix sp. ATG1]|nr:hypothetical protein [Candidatus Electrothrix sp. ATG1]
MDTQPVDATSAMMSSDHSVYFSWGLLPVLTDGNRCLAECHKKKEKEEIMKSDCLEGYLGIGLFYGAMLCWMYCVFFVSTR